MSEKVREVIQDQYGSLAERGLSNDHAGVRAVAEAFGYSSEQLATIPPESNLGVSCGNPTAFASLRPGEVVVDLGSGGGLDVFLAASKVGPTGKAIGIDMTPEMLELARRNAARGLNGQPFTNVEFHLGTIEQIPLENETADCVISNCVINLAPDKPAVFREVARILKPGGRLAISDIALKQPLPEELATDLWAYAGCISGAISFDDYRHNLLAAGFSAVDVVDTGADLNAYASVENQAVCCGAPTADAGMPLSGGLELLDSGCCSPTDGPANAELHQRLVALLQKYNINDFAASVRIYAVKPE